MNSINRSAATKRVTPESVLKKRKAVEKNAAERVAKDIERRKVRLIKAG